MTFLCSPEENPIIPVPGYCGGDSMTVQALEARRLLSTAVVTSGVLTITGTDANNYVSMNFNGALNRVSVNDSTAGAPSKLLGSFNPATFTKINVKLLAGNDYLSIAYINVKPMTIDAGAGNDNVAGGDGNDSILGGLGDDYITASKGNDLADGGDGNDNILGGLGNDNLKGGVGSDVIGGQQGNDLIDGGTSGDQLRGGEGIDTVTYASRTKPLVVDITDSPAELPDDGEVGEKDFVHSDVENVIGGSGNDKLTGTVLIGTLFAGFTKNNQLTGGAGKDSLLGLDGDDVLNGGLGNQDQLLGGSGIDTASYAGRIDNLKLTLDGLFNDGAIGENDQIGPDIENVTGGNGNDTIVGSAVANILRGGSGNDSITGGAGVDQLFGEAGNDKLFARDTSNDKVDGGAGIDAAQTNAGDVKTTIELIIP